MEKIHGILWISTDVKDKHRNYIPEQRFGDKDNFIKFALTPECIIVYLRYRIINDIAITKFSEFNTKGRMIAALCKALFYPAQIVIINFLIKKRECICSDVVNELPLSQSTLSQHLKELKNARLIIGDIDGLTDKNGCIPDFLYINHNCRACFPNGPCSECQFGIVTL